MDERSMVKATCKYCKKPIEDDINGFCNLPGDPCWKAWLKEQRQINNWIKYYFGK